MSFAILPLVNRVLVFASDPKIAELPKDCSPFWFNGCLEGALAIGGFLPRIN